MSLFAHLKLAARRAVAPVARPLWRRVRPRIRKITDLFKLSEAWQQLAPSLVNAAASVKAIAREQQRMKRDHDEEIARLRAEIAELREALARRAEQ
jgi:hypothetical protein